MSQPDKTAREPWDDDAPPAPAPSANAPSAEQLTEWAKEYRHKAARAFDAYSAAYWHYEQAEQMATSCELAAKWAGEVTDP